MLKFTARVILWLRGGTLKLLTLGGSVLLIWRTLAPVETLVWWLLQDAESLGLKKNQPQRLPSSNSSNSAAKSAKINCYIVFLAGVGNFSPDELAAGEALFIHRLVQAHPNCVGVRDVFPYSAANESLGGERLLDPLWRFANKADGLLGVPTQVLIQFRNIWRFAIEATHSRQRRLVEAGNLWGNLRNLPL